MAVARARRLGGRRVEVFSGGSDPAAFVNSAVVAAMAESGVDISWTSPHYWDEDVIRGADAVVTMGCRDSCPYFPRVLHEDWETADPAGLDAASVRPP